MQIYARWRIDRTINPEVIFAFWVSSLNTTHFKSICPQSAIEKTHWLASVLATTCLVSCLICYIKAVFFSWKLTYLQSSAQLSSALGCWLFWNEISNLQPCDRQIKKHMSHSSRSVKNIEAYRSKMAKPQKIIYNRIAIHKCIYMYMYIYISAVKWLIASKIKVFVYIINECVLCIFIMSI